ncbi:MAG: hypothetical protein AB1757_24510 [Acidobacteriota bacterium]
MSDLLAMRLQRRLQTTLSLKKGEGTQRMFELILLVMLLFTGFCAMILVWSFFNIFGRRNAKRKRKLMQTQMRHSSQNSRA